MLRSIHLIARYHRSTSTTRVQFRTAAQYQFQYRRAMSTNAAEINTNTPSPPAELKKPKGGKFARRNAKRKARRDGVDVEEAAGSSSSSTQPNKYQKTGDRDPSKFNQGKWSMSKDGSGGFMVEPPECPRFIEYYKAQGILEESEWPEFMSSLKTKLPTTFRLSTINGMHYDLLHQLNHELNATPQQTADKSVDSYTYTDVTTKETFTIEPPRPLPWYPDSLGWYIRAGKSELKTKGNKFEAFRQFLMSQNEQGNLNRQEAVSMIPPLLLDVQPHHIVLDMCAAPGSKTAQLLEGLHGGVNYSDSFKTPSGMVIANDADYKRAYLLVHQLKRYGSSAFLVTTHDGQQFPNIYEKDINAPLPTPEAIAAASAAPVTTDGASTEVVKQYSTDAAASSQNPLSTLYGSNLIQFDRILCDVPCSGDGTMRKNINLWSIWDTKFANGLHFLQLMISCRALEMLKVGGLMVYSTCSFNPIENESVVMELIRRCKGNLEIVDVSTMLPGLIRKPGLTTWKVRDTYEDRWADMNEPAIRDGTHKILRTSMFPPTPEEAAAAHLERCMRIVPHAQDTGGFFITLLRKTGETPNLKGLHNSRDPNFATSTTPLAAAAGAASDASSSPPAEEVASASVLSELPDLDGDGGAALPAGLDDPAGSNSQKKAAHVKAGKEKKSVVTEDPFIPMPDENVQKIIDFYGLGHDGVNHDNFFTRSEGNRKCYFVAPAIARILHCPRNASKLKIVHTGSRCYERGTKDDAAFPCQFRVVQEGVESILPFMTKQILTPNFKDAMTLLWRHAWPFKEMIREGPGQEFYRSVIGHKNGCIVMVVKGSEISQHRPTYTTREAAIHGADGTSDSAVVASAPARRSIPICVWKTQHSISLMISPVEQKALLHLLDPLEKFQPEEIRHKRQVAKAIEEVKQQERAAKQMAYIEQQIAAAATAVPAAAAAPAAEAKTEESVTKMEE